MSSARITMRNLAVNWGSQAASAVVLFFLSPFVVHNLGDAEYGIWTLLVVTTGYLGILDLGIRSSTGRYILVYLGKKDYDRMGDTIRTGLGFYSAISVLIFLVSILVGWLFPKIYSTVPAEYHRMILVLLPLMAVNLWITAFSGVLASVLTAYDRFDLARGADMAVLIVRTAGTVWALWEGYGIVSLVLVMIFSTLLGLVINYYLARRIFPLLKVWPFSLNKQRIKELFGYGIYAFISSVAGRLIGQTDLILVGILLTVSLVKIYSVGAMAIYYSASFFMLIASTFFPPVQRAVSAGEMGSARWLFFRQVRLSLLCGVPVYIGFIVYAKPFIQLWMYDEEAFPLSSVEQAAMVMGILAVSKLLYLFTVGGESLLQALGFVRFTAGITIVEAIVNLSLSVFFVLVWKWGLAGVAAGTLVSRFLVRFFILPWYASRKSGFNLWSFLIRIYGLGSFSMVLFASCCYFLREMMVIQTWMGFLVQVGLALVCYVPIAWWIILPREDRKRILQWLRIQPVSVCPEGKSK